MKRVHRKIVSGALLYGCALFALYGASGAADRREKGALPVSLTDLDVEKPLVIIDAGHGGST